MPVTGARQGCGPRPGRGGQPTAPSGGLQPHPIPSPLPGASSRPLWGSGYALRGRESTVGEGPPGSEEQVRLRFSAHPHKAAGGARWAERRWAGRGWSPQSGRSATGGKGGAGRPGAPRSLPSLERKITASPVILSQFLESPSKQWFTFGCGPQMSTEILPGATSQHGHRALPINHLQNTIRPKTRRTHPWNAFPSSLLPSQSLQLSMQWLPTDFLSVGKRKFCHIPNTYQHDFLLILMSVPRPYHFCPLSSSSLHEIFLWYL